MTDMETRLPGAQETDGIETEEPMKIEGAAMAAAPTVGAETKFASRAEAELAAIGTHGLSGHAKMRRAELLRSIGRDKPAITSGTDTDGCGD